MVKSVYKNTALTHLFTSRWRSQKYERNTQVSHMRAIFFANTINKGNNKKDKCFISTFPYRQVKNYCNRICILFTFQQVHTYLLLLCSKIMSEVNLCVHVIRHQESTITSEIKLCSVEGRCRSTPYSMLSPFNNCTVLL